MNRGFLKTLRFFHLINKKAYKKRMKKYAPEYRAIAKSPLFDAKWYLEHNPDVAAAKADPVEHYLTIGWKEDRPTSPYFDGQAYLRMYSDVAEADMNPLAHYELFGKKEGRTRERLQGKRFYRNNLSVKFSIIMPTYNRKNLIGMAIDSLLRQTYRNFELIIVDDGSIDCTGEFLKKKYGKEISTGIIRYFYQKNSGCCKARNFGLKMAKNDWIAYLDSDNELANDFLETMASAIECNPETKTFYGKLITKNDGRIIGREFDYNRLISQNFIDLGTFVHHRSVYEKLGGFDENMTRLVDYDVITRYTKIFKPIFIDRIVVNYNDSVEYDRITTSANLMDNWNYYKIKNTDFPEIDTIIMSFNNEKCISKVIENIVKQKGNFIHKIIISDNFSSDNTRQIIELYAKKYTHLIKNISGKHKINDADNLKRCMRVATGKYFNIIDVNTCNVDEFENDNVLAKRYRSLNVKPHTGRILIHIHLFYGEQVHYFISNLKNICCEFDLYVTCVHVTDCVVSELKKFDKNVHIIKVKNIGYDVYPFWVVLQLIDLNDYDFVLKLHTKNQRNASWSKDGIHYMGFEWRNDLVEPLIGSKKLFKNALNSLNKCENGMVCSENLIGIRESLNQVENTKKICNAMGYRYGKYPYSNGTMFMMKSFLLNDFKKYKFNENDFSSNSSTGSTGTLAHSIETLFGIIVANYGLKVAGVHNIKTLTKSVRRDVSRFIKKIFSKKRKFYENDLEYIKRSKLFNKKWYKKYYKLSSDISPEEHYLHVGWKKGFNPSPDFKTEDYLSLNQDVKRANMNPLLHYEKHGKYENRQATIYNMVNDKSILNKISNCSLYGITRKKRNQKVIVSLTTYPARINEVAVTIYSLLKQSLKPDEIVLWLGADKFKNREKDLPENLLKLKNNGLTIKWCKDMRSFTKLVPALEEYKNDVIVTADDDIYYNKDWLKKLYEYHVKYPNDIICHRVHEVTICDNKIAPYNCWKWASNDASSSYFNFLTGVGGVLYPANSLYKDVLKRSVFEKLCPYADDVWFWAMAILNKTKIRNIKNGYNKLMYTNLSREKGLIAGDCLYQKNIGNNYNDVQIENVINKYKNIRRILKLT